jgi:hypothetical protein
MQEDGSESAPSRSKEWIEAVGMAYVAMQTALLPRLRAVTLRAVWQGRRRRQRTGRKRKRRRTECW